MKRGICSLMIQQQQQHHRHPPLAGDTVLSALGFPRTTTTNALRRSDRRAPQLVLCGSSCNFSRRSAATCKALKGGGGGRDAHPPVLSASVRHERSSRGITAAILWEIRRRSQQRISASGAGGREHRNFRQAGAGRATRMSSSGSVGPPDGYRPNVGVCVINAKNEVFVASRLDIPESWQMPQGGVDDGEEPRAAAFRELKEETGVSSVEMIGEVPDWLTYDFPPDVKAKITRLWGREWFGQAQKWFLFRFQGEDSEIDLKGDGSEQPEFGDWRWLPAEDVLKKAVDFKRPVYAQAFKALAVHIDAWGKL